MSHPTQQPAVVADLPGIVSAASVRTETAGIKKPAQVPTLGSAQLSTT
ncbi:hypothetical protein [Pantoea allii]|nr:hypothetical protein [Pantoea allii]MDJ0090635.1 hypothetical protein [Pantoea allii]